jgi:hypothetical protein
MDKLFYASNTTREIVPIFNTLLAKEAFAPTSSSRIRERGTFLGKPVRVK